MSREGATPVASQSGASLWPPFRGEVFYDGQCPICLRGIARFGGLLARHGFKVEPLQTPGTQERAGRSREAMMRDMHLLTADGRVMAGVDAYLHIGDTIGWLRPIAWIARLPGLRWLADQAYRCVADNRYRLLHVQIPAADGGVAEDAGTERAATREPPHGVAAAPASCPIGPRCSRCGLMRCRGTLRIMFAGGAVWIAMLVAALAGWAALGPIELMVLMGVLFIIPLGLPLVPMHIGWTLPVAAGAVAVSFLLPVGWMAGAAAAAWPAFTLILAVRAAWAWWTRQTTRAKARRTLVREKTGQNPVPRRGALDGGPVFDRSLPTRLNVAELARAVAPLYLPIGAAWLAASRAGIAPMGFAEPIVLLTAAHFHFAGFAAVLFCGSVGRWIEVRQSHPARRIHAAATLAVMVGTPLLAAGFVSSVWLKFVAAILLTGGLAVVCGQVLRRMGDLQPPAAALLGIAATSAIVAAVLAMLYVAGETQNEAWISIPAMAASHGLLNGLGFATCGLAGCRLLRSSGGG